MNATELFHKDGTPTDVWYCGKCHLIFRSKEGAAACCDNYKCSTCGKDTGGRAWIMCENCRKAKSADEELKRFEKAEKLAAPDSEMMYWKGFPYNERYFQSIEELMDYCADEEITPPSYVWACDKEHFVHAEVSDIIEQIGDCAYEGFEIGDLCGVPELEKAIEVFNAANHHHVSFTPNYRRAVVLKTPETK